MGGTLPELPDAIHCLEEGGNKLEQLCRDLLWLRGDPILVKWGKRCAKTKGLESAAEKSPMLRVALQVAAMLGAEALLPLLRKIYRVPVADGLLHSETDAAKSHAVSELLSNARDWLGIERRRQRRRPFRIGASPKGAKLERIPVTALVIDSSQGKGIEDGLRSITCQSRQPAAILALQGKGSLSARIHDACAGLETPYVTLLNSGSSYHPQRLETCLAAMQKASQPGMACTGSFLVDAEGRQVSAPASSRLEQGCAIFDWILDYERLRPTARNRHKLIDAVLAGDFVLSLSNLFFDRSYLQELTAANDASDRPLYWQLTLRAALDGRLSYMPRKLLAVKLPRATVFGTKSPSVDRIHLQLTRTHASDLAIETRDSPPPAEGSKDRSEELDRAQAVAERDRMAGKLDLLTRNRDRLEEALAQALRAPGNDTPLQLDPLPRRELPLTPAVRSDLSPAFVRRLPGKASRKLRIAAPHPPDQEALRSFRRLCRSLGCRPHVFHWQGESTRLASSTLLRSDPDAQNEDLGYLRRNHPQRLEAALSLFSDALELTAMQLEGTTQLRRAFTFARKIEGLKPDYLHSWGLGEGSTAALLGQLLYGIRRGLVLSALPEERTFEQKLLPLQFAAADFLMVDSKQLARTLIERGVESNRILLSDGDANTLLGAIQGHRDDPQPYQGVER